jgi:hypothetical protein
VKLLLGAVKVDADLEGTITVVKLKVLRHRINHVQMEHFARSRPQCIFIFTAQHSRVKSILSSALHLEDLLQQMDQSAKIPFQGLFLYTSAMPAVILAKISLLGHVNGAYGLASGIVVDPKASLSILDY